MINKCDVAAAATDADASTCVINPNANDAYVQNLRISHKFVRQYFNPKSFEKNNNKMQYLAEK